MTDHELLELLLQKITNIESQMATKEDVKNLKDTDQSIIELIQQSYRDLDKKIDTVLTTQTTQGESVNILALRQLQTESELSAWRKAK
ncbi:hypothetical protein SOV_17010 [Sporomusa ovata DSM 2662]|uniref:Uncharacterized protein n=1 Tax=Sporomusa ovata TaxID=2378 RepID=A0A0U1KV81_9FIRM|nr:hypothetical protein [Sporomusa ovata]EQB29301.1 hypothetical protein SOV_1c10340 [Sporomusa ovata DSM 2662]CQR71342.1 hypothetical protein SpAn4DRAFT_3847 [Sporomusa ovata]